MASKLWLVAKFFNKLPFEQELLDLTIPQLDWIVRRLAQDFPEQITITEGGTAIGPASFQETLKRVEEFAVKTDKLQGEFLDKLLPDKLKTAMKEREQKGNAANQH